MEYIQLRVARQILNLGVRDIAKVLRVSKDTVNKAELRKSRDFFHKYSPALLEFFKLNGILFPSDHYISYNLDNIDKKEPQPDNTLTRFQLRAARCIMGAKQYEISEFISIDASIISRAERLRNTDYITTRDKSIIPKLKSLFSKHHISFPTSTSVLYRKI
jgi:transcriptional regulator with XRE-family HTH domain